MANATEFRIAHLSGVLAVLARQPLYSPRDKATTPEQGRRPIQTSKKPTRRRG